MKILFAGTPAVAIPTLAALVESNHEVVAVLTRTPARKGRGRTLYPSDVAAWASEKQIQTIEADSFKDPNVLNSIVKTQADIAVVVAYGALIPSQVLKALPKGWINLHFSALPRWRGAAPVQRAIQAGDNVTAVDVFRLEEGLDTGPIYSSRPVEVDPNINAGQLLEHLALIGAGDVVDTLDAIELGIASARRQPDEGVTYAHRITKDDLPLDFAKAGIEVHNQVRAFSPTPGAYALLPDGKRLKVLQTRLADPTVALPGQLRIEKNAVYVCTLDRWLELVQVAPQGKSQMTAADWARGARFKNGQVLAGGSDEGR